MHAWSCPPGCAAFADRPEGQDPRKNDAPHDKQAMRLPIVYVNARQRRDLISTIGVLRMIMVMRVFFLGWPSARSIRLRSEVHKSYRLDCFNVQANPPSCLHRCDPSSRSLNGHADATTFFIEPHPLSRHSTTTEPNTHNRAPRRFRQVAHPIAGRTPVEMRRNL